MFDPTNYQHYGEPAQSPDEFRKSLEEKQEATLKRVREIFKGESER
jgi:hypothetical protein